MAKYIIIYYENLVETGLIDTAGSKKKAYELADDWRYSIFLQPKNERTQRHGLIYKLITTPRVGITQDRLVSRVLNAWNTPFCFMNEFTPIKRFEKVVKSYLKVGTMERDITQHAFYFQDVLRQLKEGWEIEREIRSNRQSEDRQPCLTTGSPSSPPPSEREPL